MAKTKKRLRGREAFEAFYQEKWGARWPLLYKSLGSEEAKVFRWNRWSSHQVPELLSTGHSLYSLKSSEAENLAPSWYRMDLGSIIASEALGVQPGDEVLDLCAAPGGKTLILWEMMKGQGLLMANDQSEARVRRLRSVVRDYIPAHQSGGLRITHRDGTKWGLFEKDRYDRILLDAPCSGERHLLQNPSELAEWSESRSRRLMDRQYALLCSALLALKSGGHLLYSTCSVSPLENDGVLEKFLKKKGEQISIVEIEPTVGERTQLGWMILPDVHAAGPLFFSLLKKT